MLHLILGPDWTANREVVLSQLAEDVRQGRGNRILMVPELISHDTERRLCQAAGDTASRYAEVLSFTRLGRRVADSMGSAAQECLDDGGRVVAMAAAARQLAGQLKAYASVETKPEFLTELVDAVDEFKRCCISSQDLSAAAGEVSGSLSQKLEELALLMQGYDALCSRGKRDPREQMTWLLEQLEAGSFGRDHVFYIDGFPDFTRQHLAILEHLIQVCPSVTVSLTCDRPDSPLLAFEKAGATAGQLLRLAHRAGVETRIHTVPGREDGLAPLRRGLFQGSLTPGIAQGRVHALRGEDPYQACVAAARDIQALVAQGYRYRDITLACTDLALYEPLAELVFHRFHIPLYRSGTEEILQKSVISTVLTALDAAISGLEQRETLRYLRSALSPLTADQCDLVENYAIIWAVRREGWTQVWENHPDGLSAPWNDHVPPRLEALNAWREAAITPLVTLGQGFRKADCLRDQVLALYAFLRDIRLEEKLADLASEYDQSGDGRSAQILSQLWEILLSALEQLYDVLGDTHWEAEHFQRLLRLLLSQYTVGTIPPVLDAVQLGLVSAMRCHQEKHLIVLGAEEGALPGYTGSAGVLTDQERVILRQLGVPLTGGSLEGIQAEFSDIYGLFCGAEETVGVYSAGSQPSFVFRRLSTLAGGEETADPGLGFAGADEREAGLYLARWDCGDAPEVLGVEEAYRQALAHRDYTLGQVEKQTIRSLYGDTLVLSASQIDRQADCRLSYFLRYGLRATPRKEATVDPAEFGTYVHWVLEQTASEIRDRGGFPAVSLDETLEIAHRHSDTYTAEHFSRITSQRLAYLFRRNLRELDMVVAELWQELSQSEFAPVGFEIHFGGDDGLNAIPIPNSGMPAVIQGFIDRVDAWQSPGSLYYRVVDYKTGRKNFDYCDVFNGVGLQLLIYLFALRSNGQDLLGPGAVGAGVQYFPARVPYLSADGRLSDEEVQGERLSHWRRQGLLLMDPAVLEAMEPGETPFRCFQKKKGELQGEFADRDQLKMLETYLYRVLARLVEDIADGKIDPNPYTRGMEHNPCRFCDYAPVCHPQTVTGRRNYEKMSAPRFWEDVEKEMKGHD